MNTKDLVTIVRGRLNMSTEDAEKYLCSSVEILKNELLQGNTIAIQGFGSFETKKKNERISVNPATQERMLVPPKLSLVFKPSSNLKNRYNQE